MTKISVDTDGLIEKAFVCRLRYVLDFIQNHPCAPDHLHFSVNDFDRADVTIHYSSKGSSHHVIPQKVYFEPSENSNLKVVEHEFKYQEHLLKGFAHRGGSAFMPFDIFETIFFHISRYEEWYASTDQMDQHGTMASKEQYLVKNNLHSIPVVDLLVLYFYEKVGLIPKKLETTFTISHDVDVLKKYPSFYKFLRGFGNIMLYQVNKFSKLFRHLKSYSRYLSGINHDPYDSFDWLLINDHPKITQKILFWLAGGQTQYEGFFNIHAPDAKNIMSQSKKLGYTIGLHPSYNTIDDLGMMKKEWHHLNQASEDVIKDSRQHFLRFDIKRTSKILDELGLMTDSSIGYRDTIGFRCGTGFPYHLYHFDKESTFDFLEIPLIVMDIAALRDVNWVNENWGPHISDFIDKNKYYTHITFNFHNSFFDPVLVDAALLKKWYISTFHQAI